jgi:bacillithiol biosynthesis deacetylase BshB1
MSLLSSLSPVDLAAIAAHPDDIELSCAGTVIAAKRAGKRTAIVDLTLGELSTRGNLESRARETQEASSIMQLDHRVNLGIPDGGVEVTQEYTLRVIRVLRALRPQILLIPYKEDRHPDHEAASRLAHRAVFMSGLVNIPTQDDEGRPQEPHRPLLVLHYMLAYTFEPKILIDVSHVMEDRMRAMQAYATQFSRPKNQPSRIGTGRETEDDKAIGPETFLTQAGFFEWIEARARAYGMIIGTEFAEPFWTHEPLGTQDVFSLVTKKVS